MSMILPWIITVGFYLIYLTLWAELWATTRQVVFTYEDEN